VSWDSQATKVARHVVEYCSAYPNIAKNLPHRQHIKTAYRKPEGENQLARPRHRWEDIKLDLKEI
jgi:hypothetical protein